MSKKNRAIKVKDQAGEGVKTNSQKAKQKSDGKLLLIIPGIIAVLTFIVYSPVFKNAFVNWDDGPYIFENLMLLNPLSKSIPYFFGQHYFVGNYQPLTMSLYALIHNSSKLEPSAYHTVSLFIHVLNSLLVYWFIYLLSNKKMIVASFVALFFAIHPLHVESVAWAAEMKDVLYTFFFIAGLIVYNKYIAESQSKNNGLLFFSFLLFVLSGLSKPAAVTFPLTLLLLDFYHGRKLDIKFWLEKIPFFVYAIIIGLITLKAQQQDKAIIAFTDYSILQRIMLSSYAFLSYFISLVFPYELSALNPFPKLVNGQLPYIYFVTPFIAIAFLYFVFRTLKKNKLILFGVLFYLANIILVLQFISVGLAITSDRYTYVPYIGLFFILGMGLNHLLEAKDEKSKTYKNVAIGAIVIYTFAFATISNSRCKVWNNSETLWTDVIEKYPDDYFAYGQRGVYNHGLKKNEIALKDFDKAIELNPKYSLGYNNRGNIYSETGRDSLAIESYNQAIAFDPTEVKNYTNRATSYGRMQKYELAVKDFDKAISIDPNYRMIYYNRSIYYSITNQHDKELADIDKFLELKPDDHEMYNARGMCLQAMGKYSESIEPISKAINLNPSNGGYWLTRAYSENQLGQKDKAREDAFKARQLGMQIDPAFAREIGM